MICASSLLIFSGSWQQRILHGKLSKTTWYSYLYYCWLAIAVRAFLLLLLLLLLLGVLNAFTTPVATFPSVASPFY
jgi:hypothetical protein